ncbi:MAG: hypothetical protein ABIX28_18950 [Vicinamibacterales bacterium]
MRTSGGSGRDSLMTIVPLGMLAVFIVWMAGGPRASVVWIESFLRELVAWVGEWVR